MITVLTASYNKGELALDALNSVYNQTYTDWEMIIFENSDDNKTRDIVEWWVKNKDDKRIKLITKDFMPYEREEYYVVARFINEQYENPRGSHLFWISDDDQIAPNTFERMLKENQYVVYCREEIYELREEGLMHVGYHAADKPLGKGTDLKPDCIIDGGSILFKTSCLSYLSKPYFPEEMSEDITGHCDGIFMNKLAKYFTFHPINEPLLTHRITKFSTWNILR